MDLSGWLHSLGLESYLKKFNDEEYDLDILKSLTDEEIKVMIDDFDIKPQAAKKIKNALGFSVPKKSIKSDSNVGKWLLSIGLEEHTDSFFEEEYDDMKLIKNFTKEEADGMISDLKLEHDAANKIRQDLFGKQDITDVRHTRDNPYGNIEIRDDVENSDNNSSSNANRMDGIMTMPLWLQSLGLEKYIKQFEDQEYEDMESIKRLSPKAIDEMIRHVGIGNEEATKIREALKGTTHVSTNVRQWLQSIKLEKYADKFEEEEYDSIDVIKNFSETDKRKMIDAIGISRQDFVKIQNSLNGITVTAAPPPTDNTVRQWLQSIELEKYADKFQEEEYDDMKVIKSFDETELIKMIDTIGINSEDSAKIRNYLGINTATVTPPPIDSTTNETIRQWLQSIGLQQYTKKFEEEEYELSIITKFKSHEIEEMLNKLGIQGQPAATIQTSLKRKTQNTNPYGPYIDKLTSVPLWLQSIGLQKYLKQFEEEEYDDIGMIKGFNEGEIKEMVENMDMEDQDYAKILESLGFTVEKKEVDKRMSSTGNIYQSSNISEPNTDKQLSSIGSPYSERDISKKNNPYGVCDFDVDNPKSVDLWLRSLGLQKYIEKLKEEEYDDIKMIIKFDESDINELIGVIDCEEQESAKIRKSLKQLASPVANIKKSNATSQWLQSLGLQKYIKKFEEEKYELENIKKFQSDEIESMIGTIGIQGPDCSAIRDSLKRGVLDDNPYKVCDFDHGDSKYSNKDAKNNKNLVNLSNTSNGPVDLWLQEIGLKEYANRFIEEEYDDPVVIKKFNKKEIERMIKDLNIKESAAKILRSNLL